MIQNFEIMRINGGTLTLFQVRPHRAFDDGGAGIFRASQPVDVFQYLARECDRSLYFHTTNILPRERMPLHDRSASQPVGGVFIFGESLSKDKESRVLGGAFY